MRANKVSAIMGNEYDGHELGELTAHRPLATLHFDCKYRLLDFSLSNLVNANIQSLYMVFSESKTQSVFDHLGGGREWHLNSVFSHYFLAFQEDILTKYAAGEAHHAAMIDFLKKSKSVYTVYVGNKMLYSIDFRAVIKSHELQKAQCTTVFKRVPQTQVYPGDHLFAFTSEGEFTGYEEYTGQVSDAELLNLGMNIFVVDTNWLIEKLEESQTTHRYQSVEELLWEQTNQVQTTPYEYTGYLSNIHDVSSFYQANMDMLDSKKFNALLYSSQHIITKRKNEVPTYFAEHSAVHGSQFATGSVIDGTVHRSLISRRSCVAQGAVIEDSIVMANGKIGENAEIRYAILDKNVEVKANIRLVGTRENPLVIKKGTVVTENQLSEGEA